MHCRKWAPTTFTLSRSSWDFLWGCSALYNLVTEVQGVGRTGRTSKVYKCYVRATPKAFLESVQDLNFSLGIQDKTQLMLFSWLFEMTKTPKLSLMVTHQCLNLKWNSQVCQLPRLVHLYLKKASDHSAHFSISNMDRISHAYQI